MSKLKHIGIAVCAICAFMAVSAGAAQAVPNFTYTNAAGKAIIPTAAEAIGIEAANPTATATELEVPGLYTLKGTGVTVKGGVITGEGTGTLKSLSLTGFTVSGLTNCLVRGSGDTAGTITTAPLLVTLKTIGTIAYATFEPESGTTFVTMIIEAAAGKSCPLSGSYPITGSLLATLPASGVHATTQSVTFTKADEVANEPTDGILLKGSKAYLIGPIPLKLSNDRPWGVDW
jgi:hypothetical protein